MEWVELNDTSLPGLRNLSQCQFTANARKPQLNAWRKLNYNEMKALPGCEIIEWRRSCNLMLRMSPVVTAYGAYGA